MTIAVGLSFIESIYVQMFSGDTYRLPVEGVDFMKLDNAQKEYDNQLPDEKHYCMRCDEEMESNYYNDCCEHCEEIIISQNKTRFIEKETY